MQPIDRPFRFTLDFGIVWALLAVPTFFLIRRADIGPWFSQLAVLILLPLFAAFVLYGPVLLTRQIVHSGSRGWFVLRLLVSILLAAILFAAVLLYTGHADDASWTGTATFFAMVYLHWRLRDEHHA
jgi:drug/metabolite transporter (DMT)-like permease